MATAPRPSAGLNKVPVKIAEETVKSWADIRVAEETVASWADVRVNGTDDLILAAAACPR